MKNQGDGIKSAGPAARESVARPSAKKARLAQALKRNLKRRKQAEGRTVKAHA